jgi:FlaA1/EpsC-like NDP-sugar epimerase
MNTEKTIEANLKELTKRHTICFTFFLLVVNFIFQNTLPLSAVLYVILMLFTIFIIHRLFVSISLKTVYLLVPNKLADDHRSIFKLHNWFNEQIK